MTSVVRQGHEMTGVQPPTISFALATPLDLLPAKTPFDTGSNVIDLLDKLALASQKEAKPRRVNWRLAQSGGGSATFRPVSNPDLAAEAAISMVRGLTIAESEPSLDRAWDLPAAAVAEKLALRLGNSTSTGLSIVTSDRAGDSLETTITRRTARHLHEATRMTVTSYGSVVGVLGGASSRPRRRASLWSDVDGRRIEVRFTEHHDDDVREAWAKDHVEVTGVLHENAAGQILRIDMDALQVTEAGGPELADLVAGSYPNLTGGLSTPAYLSATRGED